MGYINSLGAEDRLYREVLLPTNAPCIVDGEDIKIINSTIPETDVNSYGKTIGVIVSIGIAVISALAHPFHLFFSIYDQMRSHSVETQSIREDLAKNCLKALKKALPEFNLKENARLLMRASSGERDKQALTHFGFSETEIQEGVKQICPLINEGKWKDVIKTGNKEIDTEIDALDDDIFMGLKKARIKITDPWVQHRIAFVSLAQISLEHEEKAKRLTECKEKVSIGRQEIEELAHEAKDNRQLELFLLRKGVFGKDPASEAFQAGKELISHRIGELRDQDFFSHGTAIVSAINFPPEGSLEEHLKFEVKERLDKMQQAPLYQKLLDYEGRENQLIKFVQDLSSAVQIPDLKLASGLAQLNKEISYRSSLLGKTHHLFFGKQNQSKIINLVLKNLTAISQEKTSEDTADLVKTVCYTILAQFDQNEFDRSQVNPSILSILKKDFTDGESETFKTAVVSSRLGINPLGNKGVSSSKIYRDLKGKPIGIFKVGVIGLKPGLKRQGALIIQNMLRIQGQRDFLPYSRERAVGSMLSERATYLFSEQLELGLVPTTEIVTIDGSKGSFQHFVDNYREAQDVSFHNLQNATESEINQFQIFAIFDYLIGNLDRKADNWLVSMRSDTDAIKDIKMIDNANAFPERHLPSHAWCASRSQYKWKQLELAKAPLSNKAIEFIQKLTPKKIQEIITVIQNDIEDGGFLSEKVIKTLEERAKVIRNLGKNKGTLKDLSEINTTKKIQAYLNPFPFAYAAK